MLAPSSYADAAKALLAGPPPRYLRVLVEARSPAVAAVFSPVQPPTTFEETVERLGVAIRLGLLPPSSRLPPERDLAEQLSIARSTLRQAITALVQSGHLVSVRGRGGGTFVTENPPLSPPGPRPGPEWREKVDWRLAVESGAVALACSRITAEEVEALTRLADEMDEAHEDFEVFRRADVAFHLGLAEATRVPQVISAMTDAQSQMGDLIAYIPHPPAVLAESNRQHRKLLGCLSQGDLEKAMRCTHDHVRATEHVLGGLLLEDEVG
jgi:GntR family transcriptional regulator, transcriptional repressor for pyruvate dehydrogenase complex